MGSYEKTALLAIDSGGIVLSPSETSASAIADNVSPHNMPFQAAAATNYGGSVDAAADHWDSPFFISPLYHVSDFINQEDKTQEKKTPDRSICQVSLCWHYLSSRAVASQVLSAETSLTTVFGMGTGGPSP